MTVNSTLTAILAELQSARTAYLAAIAGLSTQITNLHNQVVTIKNDTTANKNLLTTMDGRLANIDTDTSTLITGSAALLAMLTTSDGRLEAIKEDTNTLIFHTTNIEEWNLRDLLDPWATDILNNTTAMDNSLNQLKTGWSNFGWPMLENIFYAINQGSGASFASTDCFNCDRPALLPPISGLPPSDEELHCQRVQYYITTLRDTLSDFIDRFISGITLTTTAGEILLLSGVIPGIDAASIPLGLITAIIAFAGTLWKDKFVTILDALEDHYDALVLALFQAATSTEAEQAWYAWVDEFLPSSTDFTTNLIAKIWGNSLFMNALYDQATYEWPGATGFDEGPCEITPESFTVRVSIPALVATSPGSLAHQVEDVRPWLEVNMLCDYELFGPLGWSCNEDGYVENANINTLPRIRGNCIDNWYSNRRIRKVATAQSIYMYSPTSPTIEITTDWLEFDDSLGNNWRIVGEIGGSEFTVHLQRFVSGEWQALF